MWEADKKKKSMFDYVVNDDVLIPKLLTDEEYNEFTSKWVDLIMVKRKYELQECYSHNMNGSRFQPFVFSIDEKVAMKWISKYRDEKSKGGIIEVGLD